MGAAESALTIPHAGVSRGGARRWTAFAGWAVGLACLTWVLHDVHLPGLAASLTRLRWAWVGMAVTADIGSYACQGWRWRVLLAPVRRVSVFRATQAIYAGLFANEVLPMRTGEALRTYLVSRSSGAALAAVASSVFLERVLDGFWLALAVGAAALAVPVPALIARAATALGIAVAIAAVLLMALARTGASYAGRGRVARFVSHLAAGLRGLSLADMAAAAALSLLVLAGQVLAFWFTMRACGLALPLWAGAVALLIVHAGTMIPNAPGNIGSYQFFTVVALGLFGVAKQPATEFSVAAFVILTAPLLLLGATAMGREGMLRRHMAEARAAAQSEPAPE